MELTKDIGSEGKTLSRDYFSCTQFKKFRNDEQMHDHTDVSKLWVIHTRARSSTEHYHKIILQSYKKCSLTSCPRNTVRQNRGQWVWSACTAKWVQRLCIWKCTLRGTYQKRVPALRKKVCRCSLAYLINFILKVHPSCIYHGERYSASLGSWISCKLTQSLLTGTTLY